MTNVSKAERFEAVGVGIGVLVLQAVILWLMGRIRKESIFTSVLGPVSVSLNPKKGPSSTPLSSKKEPPVEDERWILPADAKPSNIFDRLDDVLKNHNDGPSTIPRDFVQALMNMVSKADIKWIGCELEEPPSEISVPLWSRRIAEERVGSFNGFSADSKIVGLEWYWIQVAKELISAGNTRLLIFILVTMIRALQMHPDRSNEIRVRAIFVWKKDVSMINNGFYSLVFFPTSEDFQDMLEDIRSPLGDGAKMGDNIAKNPLFYNSGKIVVDYKCTRGENGDIVIETLKWDEEKIKSVLNAF